ncbi:MAG: EAL domain-containing protein, partial [bacterium]
LAYKRLWEITLRQILWFALATVVACVLGWFALHRLLIPLHQVEAQAVAIGEGDFGAQSPMPKTRELRSVVGAMNRMADALKTLFSDQLDLIAKLRSEKSRDPVTGLSNREEFDSRMSAFVTSETGGHSGVLLLLDVHNLERVNEMSGRAAGNQLLATVGKVVLEALDEYAVSLVARRQGPEITAFVPDIDATEGQYIASRVFGEVSKITWDHQDSDPLYFYLGFSHTDVIESASELLQSADSALKKAAQSDRSALVNFAEIESLEAPVLRKPLEEWRQFIQSAVERRAIEIHYQPIVDVQRTNIIGSEAFARFPTENGLLSAGAIIPAAERLEMTHQLDRLIMESICEQWREKSVPHSVQINISPTTIRRENFLQLLDNFLSRNSDFAASLVLEISEHWARIDKAAVAGMNAVLNKHGAGLCIDHFGLETSSFSYIGAMNLRALKVHRSFVKDLANNPDNQFYISTLSNLARNLGIKLFVEGVETEADFLVLDSLGIDGCQGYFLAKPSAEPIVGL